MAEAVDAGTDGEPCSSGASVVGSTVGAADVAGDGDVCTAVGEAEAVTRTSTVAVAVSRRTRPAGPCRATDRDGDGMSYPATTGSVATPVVGAGPSVPRPTELLTTEAGVLAEKIAQPPAMANGNPTSTMPKKAD
ncbi:hypothetical protein [Mangrovihabitans endophyticus]|uniref:hypothetical protein n=1 Tax=Mangrovihabitans endophyticus TaxID=1751298 RepID=UPI001664473E|nr:hypothetical protein [Mangrovihabitans endophyticus]